MLNRVPLALLTTDAEKAFDRVDWNLIFYSLLWIDPQARLRINGTLSDPFIIRNGTRQGCPLSPLLFRITLEPFLQKVRNNSNITGLTVKYHKHKVAAYADDMLFFITNPISTLINLVKELEVFHQISNLNQKSSILNISLLGRQMTQIRNSFAFAIENKSFTYLGIKVSAKIGDCLTNNLNPLLKEVQKELKNWDKQGFSWFGRIIL